MTKETLDNPNLIGTLRIGPKDVSLYKSEEKGDGVIDVALDPTEDKDLIFDHVKGNITRTRWWTWEYWQEKGLPKEQLELADGKHQITVYNFGESLAANHLTEISTVLGVFSGIRNGEVFNHVHSILIDNTQPMNDKSGESQNGHGPGDSGAIILYPNAFRNIQGRVPSRASHLEATFAHELTHGLANIIVEGEGPMIDRMVINQWKKVGNWVRAEGRVVLPGGFVAYEVTQEPERCVTEYAKSDSEEDLCESMVAYLFGPENLDPQKLKYLQENFPVGPNKESKWDVSPADVKLPETPGEFKVRFIGRRVFIMKNRTGFKNS